MFKVKITGSILIALFISGSVFAQVGNTVQAENELKKYVNQVVQQVKNTDDPEEKRAIMNESLEHLSASLTAVKSIVEITGEEQEFIDWFINDLQEKQNELNGMDGFSKVQDVNLNDFADYIQQDIEQARTIITISLTSALIIALILVLLAS